MNLVQKIYNHASENGYQGSQEDVTIAYSNALNETDAIETAQNIFTFIESNGYNLPYATFDTKYWNWIGTRPKGR